jgi:hypothetical protein
MLLSDDAPLGAGPPAEPVPARNDGAAAADRTAADAWILMGDLDAALFQSGLVGAWLERLAAPHLIVAGGVSALNAVLALEGEPRAFRIGWERLRAGHLLASLAAERSRLLAGLNGRDETRDLARLLPRTVGKSGAPSLQLLVGAALVDASATPELSLPSLLEHALKTRPAPPALAAAIEASCRLGARRLLVAGIEEPWIGQREVAHAIDEARVHGIEVAFFPLSTRRRPGLLGYVLPGLGSVDRLWRDGRKSALRWIERVSADERVL